MIGRLTGRIVECGPGQVLVDVGGVGYSLQITLNTFYALTAAPKRERASLEVHTHVREDALLLFGFHTREEKLVFEQLISISGVGPRLALSILSGIDGDDLRAAVEKQDRERLQKIPGVGKKTAERLLLELRDKMSTSAAGSKREAVLPPAGGPGGAPRGGLRDDAMSALLNIGYSQDVAARAVDSALSELGADADLQAVLRASLGGLAR